MLSFHWQPSLAVAVYSNPPKAVPHSADLPLRWECAARSLASFPVSPGGSKTTGDETIGYQDMSTFNVIVARLYSADCSQTMWTIRLRDFCLMFLNVFYIDKADDRSVLIRRSRFLRNVHFPEASNSTFSINDIAGAAATHRWQTCPPRNIATDVTFGWIVFVVEKSGAVWVDNMWQGWTNFAGEVNQLCGKRCQFGWTW